MPNQSFRGAHDDMNLITCDFTKPYKNCQPSEKLCRFAYASWCPVCDLRDDPHRRRSKSECVDTQYRKRGRDALKTPSPKKKDVYAENFRETSVRVDSDRVRANLCELPTTYISNCQTNVPSAFNDATMKFSCYVEPFTTSSVRNHMVYSSKVDCAAVKQAGVKCNGVVLDHTMLKDPLNVTATEQQVQKKFTPRRRLPVVEKLPEHNHQPAARRRLPTPQLNRISPDKPTPVIAETPYVNGCTADTKRAKVYQFSIEQTIEQQQQLKANAALALRARSVETPYVNNCTVDTKRAKVHQHHAEQAIEHQTKVRQPIGEQTTEHITKVRQPNVEQTIERQMKVRQPNVEQTVGHQQQLKAGGGLVLRSKSVVKVTTSSIKNRHKLSTVKLRKVRNKIAHSVSSDSNLSESDCSESDEARSETSGSDVLVSPTIQSTESLNGSTPIDTSVTASLNEVEIRSQWPIRQSLFAFIPPYISFSSHDSEIFRLRPTVGRAMKWRLSTITPVIVRKTISNTGFRLLRNESSDWLGTWGKHIKSTCFQSLKETQKLNHFPGTFQIGRKDRLWKNLQRLMLKFGQKEFGFIPRTFVLPHDIKLLRQAWERTGHEKWIIKPPASARGTGIKVIHRWAHLPKKKSLVVQQYISDPYLINGSKFDLRLYVLVTSFSPLRIYLYPDGLARFASTKYSDDLNSLSDRYMHLTNYSINKLSSQYTANEDANACKGHKWTLSKLWEYLEKDGINTKALWRSLQQLVIKTILCGESSITQLYKANVNSRYNCYELFGIDVLLDERLKPWLLEVNISPSLHSASPLDLHVKGPLVQTLLNLAQFHLPAKLRRIQNAPATYNSDLYTTLLSTRERLKHMHFTEFESRECYLDDILTNLTGDDIRHLTQAEDELTVIGNFERIFPTQHTHYYLQFMEIRYYNRLFDAWETRYEKNRTDGIKLLQSLCERRLHLEVPPAPVMKNSPKETECPEDQAEPSTLNDSSLLTQPKKPQTSPLTPNLDSVANIRGVHRRMMNLKLGVHSPMTPL